MSALPRCRACAFARFVAFLSVLFALQLGLDSAIYFCQSFLIILVFVVVYCDCHGLCALFVLL